VGDYLGDDGYERRRTSTDPDGRFTQLEFIATQVSEAGWLPGGQGVAGPGAHWGHTTT
jgi:hypothetical protein